jgi:hypothetical protein
LTALDQAPNRLLLNELPLFEPTHQVEPARPTIDGAENVFRHASEALANKEFPPESAIPDPEALSVNT